MLRYTRLLILCITSIFLPLTALVAQIVVSDHAVPAYTGARPFGLYAIGQSSAGGIRDHPFVDGFVMRVDWSVLEPKSGTYDFSSIDAVVRRLDTLGQRLTLDVFRMKTPDYIMNTPGVQSHILRLNRDSFYTAVPWDTIALDRFDALHAALAAHRVWSIRDKVDLPLCDHPVLRQIDATPIGTNGIRDLNHSITSHPTYSREVFVDAVVRTAEIVRTHFPRTFCFVALFGMQDDITAPKLSDVLRDALLQRINTSPGAPMLGFFQENLACSGPQANNNNPLYAVRDSTFTMYQMLQSWRVPFLDSTKTDVCKTDSTGPDVAIFKALAVTHGLYFELYISDLDFPGYAGMFQRVHDSLAHLGELVTDVGRLRAALSRGLLQLCENHPNPFSTITTIRFDTGESPEPYDAPMSMSIIDILGRRVSARSIDAVARSRGAVQYDGADLTPGTYIVFIHAGSTAVARGVFVKQ